MTVSVAGAQAAPAGTADVGPLAWDDCRAGFSCYFANGEGGTPVWVAPGPGCFNLGTMDEPFNDRISSVWNRGGSTARLYDWVGRWQLVDSVPVGARVSYGATDYRNDIVDRVCV